MSNLRPAERRSPEESAVRPEHPEARDVSRRLFLSGAATLAGAFALGCGDRLTDPARVFDPAAASLSRRPDKSRIEHVIVVMMENRSFDHLIGWTKHADGRQHGLSYVDRNGVRHHTYPLAPDFQGCGHPDPDHSFEGGRIQYDGGRCDGFLRSGDNDVYSIGFYRKEDLAFLGRAIPEWTTSDRYFCAILGPTFPNRFYQHSAQTDRLSNTLVLSQLPTIWDRVAAAGLTGRYYYSDLPYIALWGSKYLPIARPIDAFFADCAAGTLPNVSFVDPSFAGEDEGTSSDDHPHADLRVGERFMHSIYSAVAASPQWDNTVLVINFDEWGGFFDHVPPPARPIPATDLAVGNTDGLLGFRTPLLVVSPFARAGHVAHEVYDHTSILKMIEWRWDLAPLSVRDATANNLANVLDFSCRRDAPRFPAPPAITAEPCPAPTSSIASVSSATSDSSLAIAAPARAHWRALGDLAARHGWPVGGF